MSIFSLFQKKDKLALVFDVGSSSVGGSLFWIQKTGAPKIIFSIREPIRIEPEVDMDHLLDSTVKALEVIAQKISTKGIGAPTQIDCVLSSAWVTSKTRIVTMQKATPFVFTSKLADALTEKEATLFEEEYKKQFKDSATKFRSIEFKNMKTTLNGYVTSKPLNQKAKELEMSIFISMANAEILEKIEDLTSRHFHTKAVRFSSFVMASFAVARDMFIHQENFLLVDIGGEVTDISMIKKDMISESSSFAMGRNFMIRGVAQGLACTLSEAQAFMSLYRDGHATVVTEKSLEPVLAKLKSEWLSGFQNALATLSKDISIPATIFITIDEDFVDLFSKTIKNEQFNQYTLTESKFRVIFLGTQALHGIAIFKENTTRDAFLIIESIYINRFLR